MKIIQNGLRKKKNYFKKFTKQWYEAFRRLIKSGENLNLVDEIESISFTYYDNRL